MNPKTPHHTFDDDTTPEALRLQFALLRKMTVDQKLAMMDQLTVAARSLSREGLRQRHPGASEAELDDRFAELVLGPELAARVREYRLARKQREPR